MATLNHNFKKLQGSYLFAEIAKRTAAFRQEFPSMQLFHLGIGNTTQPLPKEITQAFQQEVINLSNADTYSGYGDEQGNKKLREAIVSYYAARGIHLDVKEIFVSDGAKSDLANIQAIFSNENTIAIQDPVYPAYIDSSVINGYTGWFMNGMYQKLLYMSCGEENNFFPDLPDKKVDIIYLCSPNNPTGAVATKEQLQTFVDYARKHKSVIIFDSAYSAFIQDPSLPKSIYEIPGAKTCAIEINSFSKHAGFTGVRLGWTVVPMELVIERTTPGGVNAAWNRRQVTMFNGASNIAQAGGIAALTQEGQNACKKIIDYYLDNAREIRQCFVEMGFSVVGGENAPYVWVKTPMQMSSWEFFDTLLTKAHVVSTPGVGFGPHGEGYVRLSSFGDRETTRKAVESIKQTITL
jgi:LL-diaminopimelate aminotransferase